ncbi:MAG: PAS domain S-box protein [Nitrospira sp.]|nr:PAS domain S-box protein [Nitrospira sp.]
MTDIVEPQSSDSDNRIPVPLQMDEQMELKLDIDRDDYRFALEQASDIICRTDLFGRITFVNSAATRILGYSMVEILGHNVMEFISEDYRSKVWWFHARQFLRGQASNYLELQLVAQAGQTVWVGQNVQLLEQDEEIIGFQAVVRDISAIKQAEQALRASEEKLQSFFHDAPIMYFTLDSDGMVLSVNRSGAEQLGYTMSELVGRSVLNVFLVEDHHNVKTQMAACLANRGMVREWTLRKVRKDGVIIQVHERGRAVPGSDGRPVVLVVCQDITERVQHEKALQEVHQQLEQRVMERTSELLGANEALRQTTAHLQTLIEESPFAIIELDEKSTVLSWNHAATRIFGWTEQDVVGRELPYVPCSENEEEQSVQLRESIMRGVPFRNVELRRQRKDGSTVDVSFWGVARRNAVGRVTGSWGFFIDITQQKRLEQQFRQAQKMEAIGRLGGGVAHDFNNLLTVINGCSALLLDQVRREDPMHALLDEIAKAGERAADLTRQLLIFSRQHVLKPQRVNLNESLKAILSMLRRLMGEDIELSVEPEPDLWPIYVDKGQIDQVVMNLAVNGRDAMPEGGKLTISTTNFVLQPTTFVSNPLFTPGDYVQLTVRDTGYGMDQEVRSHLFEPFFTTKEEGKGTGLGLATVYGIVKQSRGVIFVDSVPSEGTTFDLYFPRFVEQDTAVTASVDSRPMRGGERVLLVEDQQAVRDLVCLALEGYGYQVFKAANGDEALRLAAVMPEPIEVLVTDVVMPRLTGPVVAERLRERWPGLKVLFMSGYMERVKPVFLSVPGTMFIQKPFLPTELAAQLRSLLDDTSPVIS